MVLADFSSSFLNAENCKDNDIITIVGKPSYEVKKNLAGQDYKQVNIPVEINGNSKTYSPSKESGNKMVKAWGAEMDLWVGKQATMKHVLKQVKGKTQTAIEAYPIEQKV